MLKWSFFYSWTHFVLQWCTFASWLPMVLRDLHLWYLISSKVIPVNRHCLLLLGISYSLWNKLQINVKFLHQFNFKNSSEFHKRFVFCLTVWLCNWNQSKIIHVRLITVKIGSCMGVCTNTRVFSSMLRRGFSWFVYCHNFTKGWFS